MRPRHTLATFGLAILAIAAAWLALPISAAGAQACSPGPYGASSSDCVPQLSSNVLTPGGSVTVTACCYPPGSLVRFEIRSDPVFLGEFRADANGAVTAELSIPDSVPSGSHTIVAQGFDAAGQPYEVATPVTVTASESAPAETPTTVQETTEAAAPAATEEEKKEDGGGLSTGTFLALGLGVVGVGALVARKVLA